MNLADLLKELRLMKGQQGYRFCLAWVAVLAQLLIRPGLLLFALLAAETWTDDGSGAGISALMRLTVRVLGRYLQLG